MNEFPSSPERNFTFVDRGSIEIMGARPDGASCVSEADVFFKDTAGRRWYMSITTAVEHFATYLRNFDRMNPDDLTTPPDEQGKEPPNYIWDGDLDDNKIKELITCSTVESLKPFLVEVTDED